MTEPKELRRTVRLPIVRPDDRAWRELRAVACESARWGNRMLAGQYASRMAGLKGELREQMNAVIWADANDRLGGDVRKAMASKCQAHWKRSGRDVLAGRDRLACYSADRALAVQADQTNNKGVLYERDGEEFVLACKLRPDSYGKEKTPVRDDNGNAVYGSPKDPIRLIVALNSTRAKKDPYIRGAVENIWSGEWTPGTINFRFERGKRKVAALVSYTRTVMVEPPGSRVAALGPTEKDGQLWLNVEDGPPLDLTKCVERMRHMKQHFKSIQRRIRRQSAYAPGSRQTRRKRLAKAKRFSKWAEGPLHQLSAAIVKHCRTHGVATLAVCEMGDGDLPWHALKHQLDYKAEEAGIEVVEPDAENQALIKSELRINRKNGRRLAKARELLAELDERLRAVE